MTRHMVAFATLVAVALLAAYCSPARAATLWCGGNRITLTENYISVFEQYPSYGKIPRSHIYDCKGFRVCYQDGQWRAIVQGNTIWINVDVDDNPRSRGVKLRCKAR